MQGMVAEWSIGRGYLSRVHRRNRERPWGEVRRQVAYRPGVADLPRERRHHSGGEVQNDDRDGQYSCDRTPQKDRPEQAAREALGARVVE
jgi:hypothetical protein